MLFSWLWDRLRSSLWLIPSLLLTGAVGLALGMLWIDHNQVGDNTGGDLWWLYGGGAEGAREVLSTVASATVTIAGVVFSITVVALTLASEQFGPRVLRTFMRDVGTQMVLGTFVSVHLYCLIVLRSVRGPDAGGFVPQASVSMAMVLAVTAVITLVYFFHHLTASLRASNVIAEIARDLESAIDTLFPERVSRSGIPPEEPAVMIRRDGRTCISSAGSGYIQAIDGHRLVDLAQRHDVTIAMACRPGDFVSREQPVAYAFPPERVDDDLEATLNETFVLGDERTAVQDVGFPVHQLTEIAVRALSPGTNDPSTALACIDRLGAAYIRLAGRCTPSAYRYDQEGRLRLIAYPVELPQLIDDSFGQIRQYGRTSSAVTIRLLDAIQCIAPHLRSEDHCRTLERQSELIYEGSAHGLPLPQDRADMQERYPAVRAALARSRSSLGSSPEQAAG
ncbi:MAG TPA: DUF2254 domain-containing protein [Nitrospira sp.]|nr:DUF2254 domain-containing protein [Nitrospira sp.]